jgi:hypothetical protein
MTKGALVELIQKGLKMKVHYGVVAAYLDTLYEVAVQEEAKAFGLQGYFSKEYSLTIVSSSIGLPVKVVRIAGVSSGVISIVPSTGNLEFKPMPVGSANFIKNLRAGEGLGVFVWFAVLGGTIKILSPYSGPTSVTVTAIPKLSEYLITDEVMLPEGFANKIVDVATQKFSGFTPVNSGTDNTDKND